MKTFLSSFQTDECVFAFNFACKTEASTFNTCVFEKLTSGCKIIANQEKKAKFKLLKRDISGPIEPQHTFHVGFKNMDVLKLSPAEIASFFEKKNINKKVLQAKPTVVASDVTPISIFQNNYQQNVAAKPKLKPSSTFSTFHDMQQNLISNTGNSNHDCKYLKDALLSPKRYNRRRPIPPPKPLQNPSNLSHSLHDLQIHKQNVSYQPPIRNNKSFSSQNDIMSIDDSLAVLNGISDLLSGVNGNTLKERQSSTMQNQKFKETLEQRLRFMQSYSDSSFDSEDEDNTWNV